MRLKIRGRKKSSRRREERRNSRKKKRKKDRAKKKISLQLMQEKIKIKNIGIAINEEL